MKLFIAAVKLSFHKGAVKKNTCVNRRKGGVGERAQLLQADRLGLTTQLYQILTNTRAVVLKVWPSD